jgi:hypothetical protein
MPKTPIVSAIYQHLQRDDPELLLLKSVSTSNGEQVLSFGPVTHLKPQTIYSLERSFPCRVRITTDYLGLSSQVEVSIRPFKCHHRSWFQLCWLFACFLLLFVSIVAVGAISQHCDWCVWLARDCWSLPGIGVHQHPTL